MRSTSNQYRYPWTLIKDAFAGKSVVDSRWMQIRSINDAEETIRYYGYDWQTQNDRNILLESYKKALDFIEQSLIENFPEPLRIHSEVKESNDLRQVLYWTNPRTRNKEVQLWSCAVLKVLHTILHLENDFLYDHFQEARSQIFERFHGHLYIDENNHIYFGKDPSKFIPLYYFEVKREKDWKSKLIKLLQKPENTATRIFDHIGVRMVTENLLDVLQIFNYLLISKIFIFANITPSRSRNTLLDIDACQKYINRVLRQVSSGKLNQEDLDKKIYSKYNYEELLIDDPLLDNPYSLDHFRSIQFTCRHLVRFANPTYIQMMDLRQHMFVDHIPPHSIQELDQILSGIKREIKFFFPFEIQIMDKQTFLINQKGLGSHAEYKQNQLEAARKRVLGKLLEPYNSQGAQ